MEGGVKYWDISCCPLSSAKIPPEKKFCVIHILISLWGVFWCLHPMKDVEKKSQTNQWKGLIKHLLHRELLCKLVYPRKRKRKGRILQGLERERLF